MCDVGCWQREEEDGMRKPPAHSLSTGTPAPSTQEAPFVEELCHKVSNECGDCWRNVEQAPCF